jgi:excisionase family DNA binding protein
MIPASKAATDNASDDLLQQYLSLPAGQREQEFINTARAAKYVGVSRRTIQFWIEVGDIKAVAIGKNYKVHLKSLVAHIQKRMNEQEHGGA